MSYPSKIFFIIILTVPIILCIKKFINNQNINDSILKHKPKLDLLQSNIEKLFPYLSDTEKYQLSNIKLQPDKKSYTIDKNHVHLCIIDPDTGKYYDNNLLTYVLLHEIAHIFCDEEGHTEKYIKIFKNLLNIGAKAKIYDPDKALPKMYCGVPV